MSRCHGSKICGSQQTVVLGDKKDEKIDMHDFPLHDCTQKQKGSPYFFLPSFGNANGRLHDSKNFAVMVMQACSKRKMTGGAERVAHINSSRFGPLVKAYFLVHVRSLHLSTIAFMFLSLNAQKPNFYSSTVVYFFTLADLLGNQ